MKTFIVKLIIRSPLATPLQADTLFGHICWGIVYNKGEKELEDFLNSYDKNPPLILSNAFPVGLLPKPVLKPAMPQSADSIEGELRKIKIVKKLKKIKYLPKSYFLDNNFRFSEENLQQHLSELENCNKFFRIEERMHNIVNRITGTTKEDGLFSSS
ncbi:MAG: type III-A CRISPR-associated RAMP protein Csm4 [Brevinematia bacterium]